jgi:hypothetical protein
MQAGTCTGTDANGLTDVETAHCGQCYTQLTTCSND